MSHQHYSMKRRESLEILQTEINAQTYALSKQMKFMYIKVWNLEQKKKITKGKLDVIRVRKAPPTKPETYQ